ncbi:MAG TPA: MlaD family protein [Polyangiaceae bacterium]|nr:MlaD family protein [Polyangiaceae bacterium]
MLSSREIKVGAFVFLGLLVIGVIIFMIGQERQLFKTKNEYKAVFENVGGLRRGSTVQMGGVDVGSVGNVAYSSDPKDDRIYVTFHVVDDESRRIRRDSVATIEGKGLLGDKMIVITPGSANVERVPPGGVVKTKPPQDFGEMLKQVGNVSAKAEAIMENLERTTQTFADEKFNQDVKSGMESLSNVLRSMDEGKGYVPKLLHDEAEAERLSRTIQNLERATAELNQTLRGVNDIVARVQKGPGFVHDVVYGEGPSKTIEQFGGAAEEVRIALKGIREGSGMARGLLYGDDQGSGEVMANLNDVSRDLKEIVAGVRAGKGTIGALLVDPSVYEDLKLLLGNVERNKTLRALVRYSIKRDEQSAPSVEVADPAPIQATPAAGKASGSVSAGEALRD